MSSRTIIWVGESWRNDLSNSRALLGQSKTMAVCVFCFVWYCFLLSRARGLVNRAEIYTHKAATVLLITHIIYWSIGVVLHVEVETTTLSTRLSRKLNRHLRFSANVICEEAMQHSSTLRTPTLANCYIVVSCPRKMHQYALAFFTLYFIFVSFLFVPVQHSWFKWRSAQNDMNI